MIFASDWNNGTYPVQAYVVDYRDKVIATSVRSDERPSVSRQTLIANYPNPFNSTTYVTFTVPSDGHVIVKVFDVLGKEVVTLFDDLARSGRQYNARFDGGSLPSGVYFTQLESAGKLSMMKMVLLK